MMFWLVVVCGALVCLHLIGWLRSRRARSMLAHLPGYSTLPFFGSMHKFIGRGNIVFRRVSEMSKCMEETKLPFVVWVGQHCVVFVSDPNDVKTVTNSCVEKPYFYNFARIWLGDGLVTAPGSIWKRSIKKLAGSFTTAVVDNYLVVFNAQALKLVENLKTEVNEKPFDLLHKYLAYTTLEAICQTALGESNITNIVTKEYYDAFNRCLQLILDRGLNILLHPDVIYRLTPAYQELKKCVNIMHGVSQTIIRKRRRERQKKEKETLNEENEKPLFKAYIDILLEDEDPSLTEYKIQSEVDTIIVGGQETVATALNFVFLMLGYRQDVQQKLYEEIHGLFGESRRTVTKEDLARMVYCEAIIYETLRLFPPAPAVMRLVERDLKLESCTIPTGATCFINIWGMNRSRCTWGPDVLVYNPDRWLSTSTNYSALLSFSTGRRNCIGKKYAMAIMKTILAHCIMDLKFVSEAHKMTLNIDLVLRPISGHHIQVFSRK